ncbi:MAG: FHA domain-containing protein [Vicinamibacterales bacterium]
MRKNLEPLKYSTLTPTRFTVYVHPAEYARIEGIIPILEAQTVRALADELCRLNRRSPVQQWFTRVWRDLDVQIESAGAEWLVEFRADVDGEMKQGDLLIDSELLLPARPELGVGERTRRITTVHSGHRTTTNEQTVNRPPHPTAAEVFARVTYEDTSGPQARDIVKDSVTIGRGGIAYPVDIRIVSSADVSREHARIRRDPESGRFYVIDLSSLGTTLNGRHVPRGYEERDGAKRENGVETALPDTARIGLADVVFLDFRKAE